MQVENRRNLRDAQTGLARALSGCGTAPAGFDTERLALAAQSLRLKRRRSAARAWPALSRRMGKEFAVLFAEYAARTPVPESPGEDIRVFTRYLAKHGKLPKGFVARNIWNSLHRWLGAVGAAAKPLKRRKIALSGARRGRTNAART